MPVSEIRPGDPRSLVLVGAALGTGRWLAENLFASTAWDRVILIDSEVTKTSHTKLPWSFPPDLITFGSSAPDGTLINDSGEPLDLRSPDLAVWIAVPTSATLGVARNIIAQTSDVPIYFSAATMRPLITKIKALAGSRAVYGVHNLFDTSMRSLDGQTIYLADDEPRGRDHDWLERAVVASGGILKVDTSEKHDLTMRVVQTMAHHSLVSFASAVEASGLDLENDIWSARTPLFETLFGLAVRVLDARQQSVIAGIQADSDSTFATDSLTRSLEQSTDQERIATIRAGFSGSLFETIRGTAAVAVGAAQAKRAELARRRRTGELIGITRVGDKVGLKVGTIVDLTPSSVTVEEVLLGKRGSAVLLAGPGRHNAARVGLAGAVQRTTFTVGHIDVVAGAELDAVLDEWLSFLPRDVRFLVPESVAGVGVLAVVEAQAGVRQARLKDEVVRTGQRSVVIGLDIRADRDIDGTVESIREAVARAYSWPDGLSRAITLEAPSVAYLGPPGSFSEAAARQCAESLGIAAPNYFAFDSFDSVLRHLSRRLIGVVPISSSSSGLVSRAITALLASESHVVAGGMVDVAVRFDAFMRPEWSLEGMRGATVYSHPQAIAQCRTFIRRWELQVVECASTSSALELVAASSTPAIAIAGADAGLQLGLKVAEREVDDLSGSITRFLVLGQRDAFGEFQGGSAPTMRSVWVGDDPHSIAHITSGPGPAFDEILSDAAGRFVLVTSRESVAVPPAARFLGRVPWSPRTPVVRAG